MKVRVTARIDEDVKAEFESICKRLRIPVSAAFNIFAHAMVNKRGFPFELEIDDTQKNYKKVLKESVRQAEAGEFIVMSFEEFERDYIRRGK
jgi:addiction module RelB/DinJ family antitoxin